jgi:hypothetical protein
MNGEFRHRASLLLNVVLVVIVGVLALYEVARASVPSAIEVRSEITTNEATPQKMPNPKPLSVHPPKLPLYAGIASAPDRRRWMIDQLRAMGVPNDTLALVAGVDFEVEWDRRFEACGVDRDKLAAVQLDMDMSKDAEMRAALGEAGFKQWDQKHMLWEAMSTAAAVTPSETDAIYALKKTLEQRKLEFEQARVKGTMDEAQINDAQDKAYSEYDQQLKAVLGESRYAKSQQLDDDFAAGNLKYTLAKAGVTPSDSQFQELSKAEQQWNQSQMKLDASSPDYAAQMKALNDARDQEYRQVLGGDTFDALQKQEDPGYSQMKKYETVWGLDDSKVDYVYNTMKNYEQSVRDYQGQMGALQAQGQKVDWDGVNKHLQQLTDQTGQTLQTYLGQYSFNRLQRNHLFLFNASQPPQ